CQRSTAIAAELLAGRVRGPARTAAHWQRRAAVAAELLTVQVGRAAARALHAAPDGLETVSVSQLVRLVGQNEERQRRAHRAPSRMGPIPSLWRRILTARSCRPF